MSEFTDTVILIYAKAPMEGAVNTRLIPDIGVQAATALQDELISHRLAMLGDSDLCDVILMCAPDTTHRRFQTSAQQYAITLQAQRGEDLGERMHNGIREALQRYRYCVIIGTDAPALDRQMISRAICELHEGKHVVLVPAEDGGYVLVGVDRVIDELFDEIAWGTPEVLEQSVARLEASGLNYSLLDTIWDIDRIEDYRRYIASKSS